MQDIYYLSATQLIKLIQTKQISAEEVMKIHLARIQKINPIINALIQFTDPDECLKQARHADRKLANKFPVGKMHGLPIAIKDVLKVKGLVCCSGCPFLNQEKSTEDATIVSRLKAEGAIVIGLTNVPELSRGGESNNLVYGRTNNPYDLSRTPGGSSGGSSALIAAGGIPFSIGSDGGGSIRQPCHCTGIAGLKPTHGLLPITGSTLGDTPGLFNAYVSYGPLARYVDDLFLGLSIVSGPDGHDFFAKPIKPLDPHAVSLRDLRIAFFTDDGVSPPTQEIQHAIKHVALALKSQVALVVEHRPDGLDQVMKLLWETIFLGGDRGEGFKNYLKTIGAHSHSPELKEFLYQAEKCAFSVTELRQRLEEIDLFRLNFLRFMENYDVLLCPAMPTPAKPHDIGLKDIQDFSYMMAHNLTGFPAAVVRCSTSSNGLPIAIQIVAKPWRDEMALAIAKQIENLCGGWQPTTLSEMQSI